MLESKHCHLPVFSQNLLESLWRDSGFSAGAQALYVQLLRRAEGNTRLARQTLSALHDIMRERTPPGFVCRLSRRIFRDPVILMQTGHT